MVRGGFTASLDGYDHPVVPMYNLVRVVATTIVVESESLRADEK